MLVMLVFLSLFQPDDEKAVEALLERVVAFNAALMKRDVETMKEFHTNGRARKTRKVSVKWIKINKIKIKDDKAVIYKTSKGRYFFVIKYKQDVELFWVKKNGKWYFDDEWNSDKYRDVFWYGKEYKIDKLIEK